MSVQSISVDYTNRLFTCLLCQSNESSCGTFMTMSSCNHSFHINCIIDQTSLHNMICPVCDQEFYDIRVSLALAYKQQDTQAFLQQLL